MERERKEERMATETRVKTYVVDADGHVLEPPTALVDYIEPAFKDRAPRNGARDGKEYWPGDTWNSYAPREMRLGGPTPVTNLPGMAGVARWQDQADLGASGALPYSQANPASFYPEPRLKVMDDEG